MVAWLEREGLGALSSIAREHDFDGSILLALHTDVKKENGTFKDDCNDLGDSWWCCAIQAQGQSADSVGVTITVEGIATIRQ